MAVEDGSITTCTLIDPPEVAVMIKDGDGVATAVVLLTPKTARILAEGLMKHARSVEKLLEGGTN
jgi:hypothetical protein